MNFHDSIEVAASSEELFRLSQDYGDRLRWDPFLRQATLVGGTTKPGVGVRALCVSRLGLAMETEYISFNPPRATAVRMTRGPWFLRSFAGSWRFETMDDGRTRVHFSYSLEAWPPFLAWGLNPILTRVFARDTRARLIALKHTAEVQPSG